MSATEHFAGETIVWVADWLDRKRRPITPQPDIGVTVQVTDTLETTTHLAETSMILQAEHTGTASGGTLGTLDQATAAWDENQHAGALVQITGGTGTGQERRVKSNTKTRLTLEEDHQFSVAPDATSVYRIHRSRWELGWTSPASLAGQTVVAIVRAKDATYTSIEKVALPLKGRKVA